MSSTNIAITGSTSNFGTYILDELLRNPHISKIYCLNRSADAAERQEQAHQVRGLLTSFPKERVKFLQVDFGAENWGLEKDDLDAFVRDVDVVIHNAWVSGWCNAFRSQSTPCDTDMTALKACGFQSQFCLV